MKRLFKQNPKESALLAICVVVFLLMGVLSGGRFWTLSSLSSVMSLLPEFGIIAFAMMMILLTGGINLSVTYCTTVTGIAIGGLMAWLYEGRMASGWAIALGLLGGLVVAILCGLLNGFLVAYLHVTPMLATLGTNLLFKGIGMNVTQGYALTGFPKQLTVINGMIAKYIPYTVIVFAVLAVLTWIVMERRSWGIKLHMVGSNETAMMYSGVNVKKLLLQVYVISAIFCFLAAIIMLARYNSMKSEYGSSYLMESILACVLGGVAITGGYGKVGGVVLSILTIRIIASGLTVIRVNSSFVDMFMGVLLIGVLIVNFVLVMIRNKIKIKSDSV